MIEMRNWRVAVPALLQKALALTLEAVDEAGEKLTVNGGNGSE